MDGLIGLGRWRLLQRQGEGRASLCVPWPSGWHRSARGAADRWNSPKPAHTSMHPPAHPRLGAAGGRRAARGVGGGAAGRSVAGRRRDAGGECCVGKAAGGAVLFCGGCLLLGMHVDACPVLRCAVLSPLQRAPHLPSPSHVLALSPLLPKQAPLKAGEKCLAQSAADKQWYRATVERAYAADPVRVCPAIVGLGCSCSVVLLHDGCLAAAPFTCLPPLRLSQPATQLRRVERTLHGLTHLTPTPTHPSAPLQTAPKYDVLFMDFGNKEHVTAGQVGLSTGTRQQSASKARCSQSVADCCCMPDQPAPSLPTPTCTPLSPPPCRCARCPPRWRRCPARPTRPAWPTSRPPVWARTTAWRQRSSCGSWWAATGGWWPMWSAGRNWRRWASRGVPRWVGAMAWVGGVSM